MSRFTVIHQLNVMVALPLAALAVLVAAAAAMLPSVPLPLRMLALALFAGLAVALVALRLSVRRGILRSIRGAAEVIERVAEGDLTARVRVSAQGETEKMLRGLDRMTQDLQALVDDVTRSAQVVAGASARIAEGNFDLSQRTEEQAATLEETAGSIEEFTTTVAHNAENAQAASALAADASDTARRGGQVVGQVVATMNDITQASQRVGEITGVIDAIAFQTNILALNAAVEAARAGEQGRGFAVVAGEVRTLAKRSAAAAREIKQLIGEAGAKVDAGAKQVEVAGRTMEDVVSSVRQVSALVAEIAAASREQSAGIQQVNTAVMQMERVVQQNAGLVENAAIATGHLKNEAAALLGAVERFKLDRASRSVAPARRKRLRPIVSVTA